ncbi:hypothetical protein MHYP_G00150960 [Metynnis hypsauchen]
MEKQKLGSQRSLITRSHWSATSGRSRGSSASSAAAIAFAEAEEAKAKIQYAEREMQIKMQKARLDAEKICLDAQLDVLNAEKTAAAAVAKAEALATALVHSKESSCELKSDAGLDSYDSVQRTKDYIQKQTRLHADAQADPVMISREQLPAQTPVLYESTGANPDVDTHFPCAHTVTAEKQVTYCNANAVKSLQITEHSGFNEQSHDAYSGHGWPPKKDSPSSRNTHRCDAMPPAGPAPFPQTYPHVNSCPPSPIKHSQVLDDTPQAHYGNNKNISDLVRFMARREVHKPLSINVFFTITLENGRQSLFKPCPNTYQVKERVCKLKGPGMCTAVPAKNAPQDRSRRHIGDDVFKRTDHDEKPAFSIDDLAFLHVMKQGLYKNEENSWVAPLPFKPQRQRLPNNREQAFNRFRFLQRTFSKKPEMKEHFFSFMENMLEQGHAEKAPPLQKQEECWYLPLFGVYHPRKPGQIRVVFDSSCQYEVLPYFQSTIKETNCTFYSAW